MTAPPVSVERRIGQRFAFNLPVSLLDVATGAEGLGFTQDLSSRGAFLFTDMARHVGEEKSSAGTEVLREAESFGASCNVKQGDWKIKSEALSNAAFNTNRRSSHGRVTSLGNRRGR